MEPGGKSGEPEQTHRSAAVLTGIAALLLSTKNSPRPYEFPIKYRKLPAVPGTFRVRLFLCRFLPQGVVFLRCRAPPSGILEPILFQNFGGKIHGEKRFLFIHKRTARTGE